MPELNDRRALVTLLREICAIRGIDLHGFCGDWIFHLKKGARTTHVFGYDFSLNSAVAKLICKDKAATSELLAFHGIAHVEHRIFHGPQLTGYIPEAGNWARMLAFLKENPQGLVAKPNEGTGGSGVMRVRTAPQLEAAVQKLFARSHSICLSPFEEIACEYRVALLAGRVEFIYRKLRPNLRGDGKHTLRELSLTELARIVDFEEAAASLAGFGEMTLPWDAVPALNEVVETNWRHNLGLGARAELVERLDQAWESAAGLAVRAAAALDVTLASVDLVATPAGLKVLEINSGIMMENLVRTHPEGPAMARRFYDRIVCQALEIG